jgi:hypothetical protein
MIVGASFYQPQPVRRRRISPRTLLKLLAFFSAELLRQLLT